MNKQIFSSTLDRRNRIMTAVVMTSIVLIIIFFLFSSGMGAGRFTFWLAIAPIVLLPVVIYGLQPHRIVLTDREIRLECPFRTKALDRSQIRTVRRFLPEERKGLWRKFGGDGLFGSFGIFSCKAYPTLHVYAKRWTRDWVLIRTATKNYIIAPDDPDAFVKAYEAGK